MSGVGSGPKDTSLVLAPGQYTTATLATEVQAKLNQIKIANSISYTVTASADGSTLTVGMTGPADPSDGTSLKLLTNVVGHSSTLTPSTKKVRSSLLHGSWRPCREPARRSTTMRARWVRCKMENILGYCTSVTSASICVLLPEAFRPSSVFPRRLWRRSLPTGLPQIWTTSFLQAPRHHPRGLTSGLPT